MVSQSRAQLERTRAAAVSLGIIGVAYAVLSVFYFYEDFFKYIESGAPVLFDRSGVSVPVDGSPYLWTILSPWRIAGAIAAVALLALSARLLWNGRPKGRALSLLTLWGVLLPQVFWYTEFLVDWHHGRAIGTALLAAVAVVSIPTMLLYEGGETLRDWGPLGSGRGRLLGTAIALGWLAFLATDLLDHSYQLSSGIAYAGAFFAAMLGMAAVAGIVALRSWALWAAVGAALALGIVPLTFESSQYLHSYGYIDRFTTATTGTELRSALSAIAPLLVIWTLASPFLHAFVRRALSQSSAIEG